MPFRKVINTPKLIVFHHPVKHWQHHLLIVPKTAVPSFSTLAIAHYPTHQSLLLAIIQATQQAATLEGLSYFTLLVNGGIYQDVPQLHFHLATGHDPYGKNLNTQVLTQLPNNKQLLIETRTIQAYQLSKSDIHLHLAIISNKPHPTIADIALTAPENQKILIKMFALAQQLIAQFRPIGYTILTHGGYAQQTFTLQVRGIFK